MALTVNDIVMDVGYALVERVVDTTLGVAVAPGTNTITPAPGIMTAIYAGAQLVAAGATPEVITVSAVTPTTFTATFANSHLATDMLCGSTFPSGQTDNPLFSQGEVLGYLADIQNEFLLRTRCIYNTATVDLQTGEPFYDQPADAIRIERISVNGVELYDTSQADLDMENPSWFGMPGTVTHWYQDMIDVARFGVKSTPGVGNPALLWYAQRAGQTVAMLDSLFVPDAFGHILKYGVLNRCWGKDGESADPNRAQYCGKRFEFGIVLALKFMEGVKIGSQRSPKLQGFNPMVRPQMEAPPQ